MVELKPFRFWCQKVLPLVYDDSLSYYELLCKVVKYLNDVITQTNTISKAVEDLAEYVQHYFDSTDFEQMVNDKLDEMAESGELAELIASLGDLVKFYDTGDTVTAETGDVVFYNGESFVIETENKGYGIEVASGKWINPNPYKDVPVSSGIGSVIKNFSTLSGGSPYTAMQGCCYDETNNRYVFWFHDTNHTTGELVITDTNLNVVSRVQHTGLGHMSDITWCADKNQYIAVSSGYFHVFNTSGSLVYSKQQQDLWVANIAYDAENKIFLGMGGGRSEGFYVKIFDLDLELIKKVDLKQEDTLKILPNTESYTAWQGCTVVDEQLYAVSSVFYGDGYNKCQWVLNHIDTVEGSIKETSDGMFFWNGTEAEGVTYNGSEIEVWGYTGADGGYLLSSVLNINRPDQTYPAIKGTYHLYFSEGIVSGDGWSPNAPSNNLAEVLAMASQLPAATVHLLTDSASGGTVRGGFVTVKGDNHAISGQITVYNGATLNIEDCTLNQSTAVDAIVYGNRSTVNLHSCVVNGYSGSEYAIRLNACKCSIYDSSCNTSETFVSAAGGCVVCIESASTIDCTNAVSANSGSIACVNSRSGQVTGFTNLGYQYGGVVLLGETGAVNPAAST